MCQLLPFSMSDKAIFVIITIGRISNNIQQKSKNYNHDESQKIKSLGSGVG